MHLTSSPIDWYAARAGGVVAFILLTLVVVLGTTLSSGARNERWPRFATQDVHRFAGLLAGTFLTVHIVAIAIDSYLPFSLSSIVVPFTSSYKPVFVGIGIVAAELLLALAISNRLRDRIAYSTWRRLHYLNFAVWAAAVAHGMGTGTDRGATWLILLEMGSVFAVATAVGWRVLRVRGAAQPARVGAVAAGSAVLAAGVAAVALGPLAFHPKPWNAGTFTADLSGEILRQNGTTHGIVSMTGEATGSQRVLVRADLLVTTDRLQDTDFQMEYLPSGATCRGAVERIDDDGLGFRARCRMKNGRTRAVHAHWDAAPTGVLSGGVLTSVARS